MVFFSDFCKDVESGPIYRGSLKRLESKSSTDSLLPRAHSTPNPSQWSQAPQLNNSGVEWRGEEGRRKGEGGEMIPGAF